MPRVVFRQYVRADLELARPYRSELQIFKLQLVFAEPGTFQRDYEIINIDFICKGDFEFSSSIGLVDLVPATREI